MALSFYCLTFVANKSFFSMVTHPLWSEDYWLFILQLYLAKPIGVKPLYAYKAVQLSCELHLPPQFIHDQQVLMEAHSSPVLQVIWDAYATHAARLRRDVKRLKAMKGFGYADDFYKDVDTNTTFEHDFTPIPSAEDLYPISLVVILDLYFKLTPSTMVTYTPEIKTVALLLGVPATRVVEVLQCFLHLDPYVHRPTADTSSALLNACRDIWQRYGNMDIERLSAYTTQLYAFFFDR